MPTGTNGCTRRGQPSSPMRTPASISRRPRASRTGISPSRRPPRGAGRTRRASPAPAPPRSQPAAAPRVEDWDFPFPPSPAGAVPAEVFSTEKTVKLNGATLALKHYGASHTDGDISVAFTEADVLHTGDTYWNGFYPFIDYSTGGSLGGAVRPTAANPGAAPGRTIGTPRHG